MNNDIWETCRKNFYFLRKFHKMSQQQVADGAKIARSAYIYAENVNPTASFAALLDFWHDKCDITPDELLLTELTESYFNNRERIAVRKLLDMLNEKFS